MAFLDSTVNEALKLREINLLTSPLIKEIVSYYISNRWKYYPMQGYKTWTNFQYYAQKEDRHPKYTVSITV